MEPTANLGLHRFALFTAAATLLLIVAGALVTSNDAGLAVPDWPLSYGSLMPPMVGNIFYEHGHRLVATFVGMLTIALAVWLWRAEPRRWVRRLGWVALAAVILQGALGGLTVLFLLPRPVSISHASLAQEFFCLTVSLALFTSPGWKRETARAEDSGSPLLRQLCAATTLIIFGQLVLGAAFRHKAIGILPHLAGAAAVVVAAVWTAQRVRRDFAGVPELRRPANALAALVAAQIVVGTTAYFVRLATAAAPQPEPVMVLATVAHVAVGALTLATSVVLTLQAFHRLAPPGRAVALASSAHKAAA
jgi:cytochrome c oxidase assembly protein subunit 15